MLIIASLVEREAMVAKERPLIASVIYNRLHDDIRLDIDATMRFAVRQLEAAAEAVRAPEPEPVQHARARRGCRRARSATPASPRSRRPRIRRKTGYLFYVVKPGRCGEHNFAKTDAEFQGYVNEYNRARDERGGKSPTTC